MAQLKIIYRLRRLVSTFTRTNSFVAQVERVTARDLVVLTPSPPMVGDKLQIDFGQGVVRQAVVTFVRESRCSCVMKEPLRRDDAQRVVKQRVYVRRLS